MGLLPAAAPKNYHGSSSCEIKAATRTLNLTTVTKQSRYLYFHSLGLLQHWDHGIASFYRPVRSPNITLWRRDPSSKEHNKYLNGMSQKSNWNSPVIYDSWKSKVTGMIHNCPDREYCLFKE